MDPSSLKHWPCFSKLWDPAQGHWSMTVRGKGLQTHCLLLRTRPPNPPLPCQGSTIQTSEKLCSALEAFPSIPSAFQKEIHQNGISPNYYRIQLDSGKGPKSFHVGKTKAGVTMKKVTAALLSSFSLKFFHLFLSSSFLSGSSHYCVWHWRWTDSWSVEVSQGGKCNFCLFDNFCLSVIFIGPRSPGPIYVSGSQ